MTGRTWTQVPGYSEPKTNGARRITLVSFEPGTLQQLETSGQLVNVTDEQIARQMGMPSERTWQSLCRDAKVVIDLHEVTNKLVVLTVCKLLYEAKVLYDSCHTRGQKDQFVDDASQLIGRPKSTIYSYLQRGRKIREFGISDERAGGMSVREILALGGRSDDYVEPPKPSEPREPRKQPEVEIAPDVNIESSKIPPKVIDSQTIRVGERFAFDRKMGNAILVIDSVTVGNLKPVNAVVTFSVLRWNRG